MIGFLRRVLVRLFGPPDWRADPEFLARLRAEAQAQHGIAGDRREELAEELLADGQISATQADRMVGRESEIPARPTRFARRLRALR